MLRRADRLFRRREIDVVMDRAVPVALELRCMPHNEKTYGLLNGMVTVTDGKGQRILFHRLWGYFDDFERRTERLRFALAPGTYRVRASEFGGKEREVEIVVPAVGRSGTVPRRSPLTRPLLVTGAACTDAGC
jgi:hypothetical protein